MNSTSWGVVRLGLRRSRGATALGCGAFALHQLCEAAVPVAVGLVIDRAVARGDLASAGRWVLGLSLLFALLSAAWQIAGYAMVLAAQRAEHDLRLAVLDRELDPRGSTSRSGAGTSLSLATSDAARTGEAAEVLAVLVASGAALLAGALVLLRTSVLLGAVTALAVTAVVALTPLLTGPLQRRTAAEQEAAARASSVATDLVDGLRPLTGLGAGPAASARFAHVSASARDARVTAARAEGAVRATTTSLSGLLLVVVAGVGAHQVLDGELSTGELVSAVGLAQFLVSAVERLTWGLTATARVRASAGRLADALAAPPAVHDHTGAAPAQGHGALSLRGVTAGRLRALDLEVLAGELLAVVGDDDGDLPALLLRERDPQAGEVLLDGTPLRAVPLQELRRRVRVAPHDAALFTEALTEALSLPRDQVAPLLQALACADVLDAAGLDDPIGERGRSLSGGQRQRLGLARAVAGDPAVLVLHEPTTAVDPVTESHLARGLREQRAGRTTVVVTTSPALLAVADRVVLLEGGRVTAQGTHAQLSGLPPYVASVLS